MRIFIFLVFLASCSRQLPDQSNQITSIQVIDRNGFTETISHKERLTAYQSIDFLTPQPYQKVLRVYGRCGDGKSVSKISSYHSNGHIWQLLEVVDGRAHGLYQEWYPNGAKKIEVYVMEGLADINDLAQTSWIFDGISWVWNEQGELIAKICYDKGLLHQPSLYYYPTGQILREQPYTQGNLHGSCISYDTEGNLMEKIEYVAGKKQGNCVGYWTPTQLLYEEYYEQDKLLSAHYYDSLGKLVSSVVDGKGIQSQFCNEHLSKHISFNKGVPHGCVEEFLPDGSLQRSYEVVNDKKHGAEWEYYSVNGTEKLIPKLCIHWHEDQIQGQVKTWYENGALESQREIHQYKKQGLSFAWYITGETMLVEEYANDLLVKGSYFKKGDKKPVSKIDEGKGIATLYTKEGIFLKKITYDKGKPLLDNSASQSPFSN